MASTYISKEQLLAKLLASKRAVTARQLERWWKAGPMARPVRRHVAGVRGSVSLFPAEAYDQAAALYDGAPPNARQAAGDRRLGERAFFLWWEGKPIANDPRPMLLAFAGPMLGAIEAVRAYEGATIVDPQLEGDDDAIFDACERYFQDHPPDQFKTRLFRAFFRNLGRRADDMFSVITTMAASALGWVPLFEPSSHPNEPSLAALVRKAFGFGDFEPETSPETQVYAVLKNIAIFADRKTITAFVLSLTEEELATARRCSRIFLEELPSIFECQNILFGKKALATLLRAFASMLTPAIKATLVIGLAWMVREGLRENVIRLTDQIEENASKARGLCLAFRTFPQYRTLFLNKNLEKLAQLPEDKRREILAVLKSAMA
jgi:hypothetical protein